MPPVPQTASDTPDLLLSRFLPGAASAEHRFWKPNATIALQNIHWSQHRKGVQVPARALCWLCIIQRGFQRAALHSDPSQCKASTELRRVELNHTELWSLLRIFIPLLWTPKLLSAFPCRNERRVKSFPTWSLAFQFRRLTGFPSRALKHKA